MILQKWEKLPEKMRTDEVRPYYEILSKKKGSLLLKRLFDFLFAAVLTVITSPFLLIFAVLIRIDSPGPAFFRQERVTRYGKVFRIFKFRTMVCDAESRGTLVTTDGDERITRMGKLMRKLRLDELPQLFNILTGDMSFVGTRPEVVRYVERYTPEMMATLLLPAGVTSEASIQYKDEDTLLKNAENADVTYVFRILPEKMKVNLSSIVHFSLAGEFRTAFRTVWAVLKRE